jgi:ribosomal protein S18 acetylase RimI-like enzyme
VRTNDGALITVRIATKADEVFLRGLYAERRSDLTSLDLAPDALATLLDFQYRARRQGYAQYGSTEWVVSVDGPVAHLITSASAEAHVLVDLVVAQSQQRRGIGRALVLDAIARATAAAVPVRVTVARDNAASLGLCTGLGFQVVGETAFELLLEHRP